MNIDTFTDISTNRIYAEREEQERRTCEIFRFGKIEFKKIRATGFV